MLHVFTVEGKKRMKQLQLKLKSCPSLRFNGNPIEQKEIFFVSICGDVEDHNKLNELLNSWHEEDNALKISKKGSSKNGLKDRFLKFLNKLNYR